MCNRYGVGRSISTDAQDRYVDWLTDLRPADVLLGRYHLEDRLTATRSIGGLQLEQAELGLAGPRSGNGGRINVQEVLQTRLCDLVLLCRGLSTRQEQVCRLRYAAVAGAVMYTAIRALSDLFEGDGEDIVSLKALDPEGRRIAGAVVVQGIRARYPGYDEIGREVGLNSHQVRGLLDEGRGRIAAEIRRKRNACNT